MRCPFCRDFGKCETCYLDLQQAPVPQLYIAGIGSTELAAFGGRLMLRSRAGLSMIPFAALEMFVLQGGRNSALMHMRFGMHDCFEAFLFDEPQSFLVATAITEYVLSHSTRHNLRIQVHSEEYYTNAGFVILLKKLRDGGHITRNEYRDYRAHVESFKK